MANNFVSQKIDRLCKWLFSRFVEEMGTSSHVDYVSGDLILENEDNLCLAIKTRSLEDGKERIYKLHEFFPRAWLNGRVEIKTSNPEEGPFMKIEILFWNKGEA